MRVTLTDKFSGRSINLNVTDKMWAKVDAIGKWAFLTDCQRKRIESFLAVQMPIIQK